MGGYAVETVEDCVTESRTGYQRGRPEHQLDQAELRSVCERTPNACADDSGRGPSAVGALGSSGLHAYDLDNTNGPKEVKVAKRVSIINFKGGVGKTTLAFHLAAGLARFHSARVLVVDMDHQSSLSIVCLGTDRWQEVAESNETVTGIFRNFLGSELPGTEIVHDARFGEHRSYSQLVDIVPANLDLDDTEIDLTSSHQGNAIQSEWNKRTLVCRWLEETELDEEYDYIVFDCAPATKVVSQNAIAASHGYIVPIVPEAVMERGAPHLYNMIRSGIDRKLQDLARMGESRAMFESDTRLVGLVITRIQVAGNSASGYTNDHTQHLRSMQRRWRKRLVKPYVKQGAGVGEAMTDRVPVYDRRGTQNVGRREIDRQFRELTATLKARMDEL